MGEVHFQDGVERAVNNRNQNRFRKSLYQAFFFALPKQFEDGQQKREVFFLAFFKQERRVSVLLNKREISFAGQVEVHGGAQHGFKVLGKTGGRRIAVQHGLVELAEHGLVQLVDKLFLAFEIQVNGSGGDARAFGNGFHVEVVKAGLLYQIKHGGKNELFFVGGHNALKANLRINFRKMNVHSEK